VKKALRTTTLPATSPASWTSWPSWSTSVASSPTVPTTSARAPSPAEPRSGSVAHPSHTSAIHPITSVSVRVLLDDHLDGRQVSEADPSVRLSTSAR